MPSILVVADQFDPHADKVCQILNDHHVEVARLNVDPESLRGTTLMLGDDESWLTLPTGRVDLKQIGAVWSRRTTMALSLQQENEPQSKGFHLWKNEWNRHLFWLYQELQSAYWLNSLYFGALADNKRYQMKIARACGFTVPPTIAANDKHSLTAFARRHNSVALKFLSQTMIPDESGSFLGLFVHKITELDLAEFGGSEEQPVILQPYIEKSFEVRYTVVGDQHFVCRIDSQHSSIASTDWRRYDLGNTPHTAIAPPADIQRSVSELMATLHLDYGALDFVVDTSGAWWFLEINSNGQWLWIEELTGLDISAGVAKLLTQQIRSD